LLLAQKKLLLDEAQNELVVALRQLSSRLPEVLQQLKEALGTDFPSTVAGDAERFQECVVRFGINYFTSQMPDSLRQRAFFFPFFCKHGNLHVPVG
jgi:hypothetical protein